MKKIAFLFVWDARWGQGILKKVMSQLGMWQDLGCQVCLFVLTHQDSIVEATKRINPAIPVVTKRCRSMLDRFVQYPHLVETVRAWRPDLIYHRYAGYFPALAALASEIPMVMEINTDDIVEYRTASAAHHVYNSLTRLRLLTKSCGNVYVTKELSERPSFARLGKPGIVISNGIDLSLYHPLPPADNDRPRLAFMGSPAMAWHGVDKIYKFAEYYPDWNFDLIGPSENHRLAPKNLNVHGPLSRSAYEPILARADIGLGTLALHRIQMHEACSLKVREYLAFGLPVLLSNKDTDFPAPVPFILRLPNTPDNIEANIPLIRRFVVQVKGTRVPRDSILHLDVRVKEVQRVEFFRTFS
jgi:glycosyltransferase involved in cell wall biosynthesis